jgi:HipA-like protein
MKTNLTAFAEGLVMGTVTHGNGGRLTFLYSDEWLASPRAYLLSVSIPLAPGQQGQRKIESFLGDYFPTMKLCSANGHVSSMFHPETFSDSSQM